MGMRPSRVGRAKGAVAMGGEGPQGPKSIPQKKRTDTKVLGPQLQDTLPGNTETITEKHKRGMGKEQAEGSREKRNRAVWPGLLCDVRKRDSGRKGDGRQIDQGVKATGK